MHLNTLLARAFGTPQSFNKLTALRPLRPRLTNKRPIAMAISNYSLVHPNITRRAVLGQLSSPDRPDMALFRALEKSFAQLHASGSRRRKTSLVSWRSVVIRSRAECHGSAYAFMTMLDNLCNHNDTIQ